MAMEADVRVSRRVALGMAGGALWMSGIAASPLRAATGWGEVDAIAARLVRDKVVPGLAITATRGGKLLHSRGYGFANLETGTKATPETVFRIGSVTKQFTGVALLLLEADGKLKLDDSLATILPDFPKAADITLRQMLNHTSGLGNYTNRSAPDDFMQESRTDYDAKALQRAMAERTSPLFLFKPGTDWSYSNTAYVLLGLVIEKLTGAPFGEMFRTRLFAPAGMIDTAVDRAADVVARRASGYTGKPGADAAFDNASFISMSYPGAAGNIRSTTQDLCRWHTALLDGKILSPAGLTALTTPARMPDGSLPVVLRRPDKPKAEIRYGLGVFMDSFEGRATVEHGGGIQGFASDLRSFPAEKVSVAVLTNLDGGGRPKIGEALGELKDAAAKAALGL